MIDRDEQVQKCTWYFESTSLPNRIAIGPKAIFDSRYAKFITVYLWCLWSLVPYGAVAWLLLLRAYSSAE